MPWQLSDFQKLTAVKGQTFETTTVELDGTSYHNCKFNQCKLIYRGGPTRLSSCYLSKNCSFEFQDNAAFMLQTLSELGWTLVPPGSMGKPQPRMS